MQRQIPYLEDMDAFPGYTYFNNTNKVLCAIQIVDDATEAVKATTSLFPHPTGFNIEESINDSVNGPDVQGETDNAPQG